MRFALPAACIYLCGACFPLQTSTTTVRGQVLYGGAALAGALVRLVATATGSSDGATRQTVTRDNGEYRFDDVPPGDYHVLVSTDRWTAEHDVTLATTVATPGTSTTHPVVTDDLLDTVLLTPAGGLRGQLTQADASGSTSFEGVLIDIDGTGYEARAAADGSFDFGLLPAGDYQVTAVGTTVVSDKPQPVSVVAEETSTAQIAVHATPAPVLKTNHPPVVQALTMTPLMATANPRNLHDTSRLTTAQIMRGDSARLHCPASDPDNDPLTFSWQVSGGTSTQVSPDTIDWTASSGAASIRCTVSDGQGGSATASRKVEVVDYRLSGAALSSTRAIFAQQDASLGQVADFDLAFFDLASAAITRLTAPGNQIGPRLFGNVVVYASDAAGTAADPYDVYARVLPAGIETRVSSSAGSEVYDIGPAGIAVANNAATCKVSLQATPSAAPSVVFPSALGGPANGAVCDRVIVGQTTLVVREATAQQSKWRAVDLFSGAITDAPLQWSNDDSVAVAFNGTAYLAAVPSLQQVFRFTEAAPFAGAVPAGALPALSGTPVASVVGAQTLSAWTAFDTTGLFGTVRGTRSKGNFEIAASGPRVVLGGASDRWLLVGVPVSFETPPGGSLLLYDLDQP